VGRVELPLDAEPQGQLHHQRALERLLRTRASADLGTLQSLPTIAVQPYGYQQQAAIRVISQMGGRALIADDVGLGKTIEAGLVIKEYLHRGMVRRVLIVAPAGPLLDQLQEEMWEKFGLRFLEYKGSADAASADGCIGAPELPRTEQVIVSLATLRRRNNIARFVAERWDMVVVDECHHIKNRRSRSYQAVRQLAANYVLFMSATPFSGEPTELWTVYTALRPGALGVDVREFRRRFFFDSRARRPRPELQERIRRHTIRRSRRQVLVRFPGRRAAAVRVRVGAEFRTLYRDVAQASARPARATLARISMLQQVCSSYESLCESRFWERVDDPALHARVGQLRDDDHPKLRCLIERVLPRIPRGEKALVFARFRRSQRSLLRLISGAGRGALALIDRKGAARTRLIRQFHRDPDVGFLVCGEGAGEGLNLQTASVLINLDLPWNPMKVEQRIGRIQRLGQRRRKVTVVNMVIADTVEDRVMQIMRDKLELFQNVIGDTEQILGELFAASTVSAHRSFEGWIAQCLLPDGTVDRRKLFDLGSRVEDAKGRARERARSAEAFDALFGEVQDASADGPTPDLPELDLSDWDDD